LRQISYWRLDATSAMGRENSKNRDARISVPLAIFY
jgi:hypothetical protein